MILQTPAKILGIGLNTTHFLSLLQTQDCQHLTKNVANIVFSFIFVEAGNLLVFSPDNVPRVTSN